MSIAQTTNETQAQEYKVNIMDDVTPRGGWEKVYQEWEDVLTRYPNLRRAVDNAANAGKEIRKRERIIHEQTCEINLLKSKLKTQTQEPTPQIFNDLLQESHDLLAENNHLREQIAELEEENGQSHPQTCSHCAELEQELAKERELRNVYQDLGHHQREKYTAFIEWLGKMLRNATIPAGCKVTYIVLYLVFMFMRDPLTNSELQISLTELAEKSGHSTSAVSDHLKRGANKGLFNRRDVPTETKDGEKRTIVHIALFDTILTPENINLEKEQGGKRKKGCAKDGSPLDPWTVTHCPEHGEVHYLTQPGLRAEATTQGLIDAILTQEKARIPVLFPELVQGGQPEDKKQDALEIERIASSLPLLPVTEEDQRLATASDLVFRLASYGLLLDCLSDGNHTLKRVDNSMPKPSREEVIDFKLQIREYANEISELRAFTIESQQQLDAQYNPPPSTASCFVPTITGLGVRCSACGNNEATRIWKAGKGYCSNCKQKEQEKEKASALEQAKNAALDSLVFARRG